MDLPQYGHLYRYPESGLVVSCVDARRKRRAGFFWAKIVDPAQMGPRYQVGYILNLACDSSYEEVEEGGRG